MSEKYIVFSVEGMSCGGCVSKIKDKMNSEHEGLSVEVSLDEKQVSIPADYKGSPLELKKTIEAAGFQVTKMESRA